MPSVLIEVRRRLTPEYEADLIEAVHSALRDAFKIPASDRTIRLIVHEPHRFACPPDLPEPERYTLISIDCLSGRSIAAKRALYQAIVTRLQLLDIPKTHVMIALHEIAAENWGIRGGQAASDVDLGFKVDV
jgi:phenylpyruvate tautomerase PptA (4-oxalocrotonate tautomerase family)